jgi:3-dehydroquinate dehydratase type I
MAIEYLCPMQVLSEIRPPVAVLTLIRSPALLPMGRKVRQRVKLVEVRLDKFAPGDWKSLMTEAAREFPAARFLLTIRYAKDGGSWPDAISRHEAFAQAFSLRQWDFVDVEWDAPDHAELAPLLARHASWTRLVCSRHDFAPASEELPQVLDGLWKVSKERGAAVAKWAGNLSDPDREIRELCAFASLHRDDGMVPSIFAMGPEGKVTRVASALLGGGWSYGHDGVGEAAPGQIAWPVLDALLQSLPAASEPSAEWLLGVESSLRLAES